MFKTADSKDEIRQWWRRSSSHFNWKYRSSPLVEEAGQHVQSLLVHMNVSVPAALRTGSSGLTLLQKPISKNQRRDRRTILKDRHVVTFTRQTFSVKFLPNSAHQEQPTALMLISFRMPSGCCVPSDISLTALPHYLGKVFIFHEVTQEATLLKAAPTAEASLSNGAEKSRYKAKQLKSIF